MDKQDTIKKDTGKNSTGEGKKLHVNQSLCMHCGTCVAMYPDTFEFSADGNVQVKKDASFDDTKIEEMKSSCPVGAIEGNS